MQITIESPGLMAPSRWRAAAEERVRFVLRRLGAEVRHVRVCLRDINGPRGGADQQCQVQLTMATGRTVVVQSRALEASAALDAALQRATLALVRLWQRRKMLGRRRLANPVVADRDAGSAL